MTVRALAAALFLFAAPAGAAGPALAGDDAEALARASAAMTAALLAKDGAAMFDLQRPGLTAAMAAATGNGRPAFRAIFIDGVASTRPGTDVPAHRLDLDRTRTVAGTDGRVYALLPTETRAVDPHRGRFRLAATTVAVPHGGAWHFFTVSDAAGLSLLLSAYPALSGAGLAPAVLTPDP